MIKVLHMLSTGLVGGAEKMTVRLLRGMDPRLFASTVAFFRGGGPIADELRAMGVPVHILDWSPLRTAPAALQLLGLLQRERYDIVQVYGLKANLLVRPVARLAGVRCLITAQCSVDLDRRPWHSWIDRITGAGVTLYLSNSAAAAELLLRRERIAPVRVRTIHNGIDVLPYRAAAAHRDAMRAALGVGPDEVLVGAVSRLESVKGVAFLVRAMAALPGDVPVRAVVAGDGSLQGPLEQLAAELVPGGARLRLLGHREDIPQLLSALDLFVQPSLWEGVPGAVMEAMCAGLPVIATRVGGTPELVVEGETGLLVPPADARALSGAIALLSAAPALRRRMGAAGLERIAREFSLSAMVTRTEELYTHLIEQDSR